MSVHSYSRCWVHLIWGTLKRERLLNKKAAAGLSRYLAEYADQQGVHMKINFVNPDHVHALIDLPTGFSIEKVVQLLKGSSSHWVNSSEIITGNLPGAEAMARYIASQEEHHRVRTFAARCVAAVCANTGLKAGVNESCATPRGLAAIAGRSGRLRASFLDRVCL
jgi:putative transposase